MRKLIYLFDRSVISFLRRFNNILARLSLFIVYFWFGALKVFSYSAATPLVEALQKFTLPFIEFGTFIVLFGLWEMLIGLVFLKPGLERVAIFLMAIHMAMTALPLVLLPDATWSGFLVPTLEGQYIIKNVILVVLAFTIAARLTPLRGGR